MMLSKRGWIWVLITVKQDSQLKTIARPRGHDQHFIILTDNNNPHAHRT